MSSKPTSNEVLDFWFKELEPKNWFVSSEELDNEIKSRFSELLISASQCELHTWRSDAQGRLAEVIVLDQFSRNIYRNTPRAFSQDPLALALAQEAISLGLDQSLEVQQRTFLYMPFMHSESKTVHQQAVELFKTPGMEVNYEFELKHKVIIDRFGRYPHRNNILGRQSSPEEVEFLTQPNSSF
ncbi:membrane protein [Vibrio tubiashii]|nr:membrane protein [Vibrio tubiashii]